MIGDGEDTPAIELVDLHLPADPTPDPSVPPAPRPQRAWGQLVVAVVAVGLLGFFVGSRVEPMSGGGIALRLPTEVSTGHTVTTPEGNPVSVVAVGPVRLSVTPGQLMVDDIRSADLAPSNRLEVVVGTGELVGMDSMGRVVVVPREGASPIQVVLGTTPDPPRRSGF